MSEDGFVRDEWNAEAGISRPDLGRLSLWSAVVMYFVHVCHATCWSVESARIIFNTFNT